MTWHDGAGRPHQRAALPFTFQVVKNCHVHALTRIGRLTSPLPHCTVCIRRVRVQDACCDTDGRVGTARRGGAPVYIDLDHAESAARSGGTGRATWGLYNIDYYMHRGGYLALLWLLGPLECGLFASPRARAHGMSESSVGRGPARVRERDLKSLIQTITNVVPQKREILC